jgi:probable F420-dependent oxidoreductase
MKLGVTFPQTEIGSDPAVIRDYAQTAAGLGYEYLLAYDHVLGANTASRPDWRGPYTMAHAFHEPMVLFGYLAALVPGMELVSGVIILPQRQTVLVAKQAAEVDVLCGGRLRLGIGVGWNPVEYEALGTSFTDRGRRVEEQISLMRQLWTEPAVTFEGRDHRVTDAGNNPLPIPPPIPLWIGARSAVARRRAGRLADGWFPLGRISDEVVADMEEVWAAAEAAGRSRADVGADGRVNFIEVPEGDWAADAARWRDAGATHLSVNTMNVGLKGADHIDAIRRFRAAVDAG